jgi:hypothetical protein
MKIILVIFFLALKNLSFGQSTDCIELLKSVSVKWKQDSLTKEKFRYSVYKQILSCRPISLTQEQVFRYLGKPASTSKWSQGKQNGIGYSYYYWDSCTIPGETCFERLYLTFNFDENGGFLYIADDMSCR